MKIGNREFDFQNEYYIMGILNVTPDSFSDGGQFLDRDAALFQAEKMLSDGADILDIGAESTRPGYTHIDSDEEIRRLEPILTAVKDRFDVPVSIDTVKADVARWSICAGADMINDICFTEDMARTLGTYKIPVCISHHPDMEKAVGQAAGTAAQSDMPVITRVTEELRRALMLGEACQMALDRVILDAGIGFGKTREENLSLISHLDALAALGYPVLLGVSRKSVIGETLSLPVSAREEGTLATTVFAMTKGCHLFRVHDVEKNRRAIEMTKAILNS